MLQTQEWHKQALCANEDPELWFWDTDIKRGGTEYKELQVQIRVAKAICKDCPVKNLCLKQGLEKENLISGTIWGGMDWQQRRRLLDKVG